MVLLEQVSGSKPTEGVPAVCLRSAGNGRVAPLVGLAAGHPGARAVEELGSGRVGEDG